MAETRTLCITPDTKFMRLAEQALLYWTWQRMSANRTPSATVVNNSGSSNNNNSNGRKKSNHPWVNYPVSVYISPSTVPGEGEVKLLEWIYHQHPAKGWRNESIAILGGDSDLVLEGLMVPTSITHNVFVLVPDGGASRQYKAVSLWETTRRLYRWLLPSTLPAPQRRLNRIMQLRTDVVLLLLCSGNDYLPKLRGSGGFHKLLSSYLKVQREWAKRSGESVASSAYLVDPDALEFNLDFAIALFDHLAATAPRLVSASASASFSSPQGRATQQPAPQQQQQQPALQMLRQHVEAGYLPPPITFSILDRSADVSSTFLEEAARDTTVRVRDAEYKELEETSMDVGKDNANSAVDDVDTDEVEVQLRIGEEGAEDYYMVSIWHPRGKDLKLARERLATMALNELFDLGLEDNNDDDDNDDDEEEDDDDDDLGIATSGYDWEIRQSAESKVDSFLYGLLWTLQTYQDGICADYAYNYGKRMAPTAGDIARFLTERRSSGRRLGLTELRPGPFTPSVSAGISCLAALPTTVKHLVPEPYCWLADEVVEGIYASCMDPESNVFDLKKFELSCNELTRGFDDVLLSRLNRKEAERDGGGRILMGDHYWTVLSRVNRPLSSPFVPPEPFSERLSKLRSCNRIRVSRTMAIERPRPRSAWNEAASSEMRRSGFVKTSRVDEIIHTDPGPVIQQHSSIDEIEYMKAYTTQKVANRRGLRKVSIALTPTQSIRSDSYAVGVDDSSKQVKETQSKSIIDVASRMKAFQLEDPPADPLKSKDGLTPVALLKQLEDAGMIGCLTWEVQNPSPSEYAAFSPETHECVRLVVSQGSDTKKAVLKEDLSYQQDRDTNLTSRQALKHHLAALVIQDVVGPRARWSDLSFEELKRLLSHNGSSN